MLMFFAVEIEICARYYVDVSALFVKEKNRKNVLPLQMRDDEGMVEKTLLTLF